MVSLFMPKQRLFAQTISELVYCNPFTPQRMICEQRALGQSAPKRGAVWSLTEEELHQDRPEIASIAAHVEALVEQVYQRLEAGQRATPEHCVLYEDLVLYLLYDRYRLKLHETVQNAIAAIGTDAPPPRINYYAAFAAQFAHYMLAHGQVLPTGHEPAFVFGLFFQIRRAFSNIFYYIVGRSMPGARLRAAVWESIFTHDLGRYVRGLYQRMGDMTTLIAGPSGTGKELVAQAIGRSRYIPLDPTTSRFTEDFAGSFYPLNLSALAPTLIESELFGHQRGAFTGAIADRMGWLEVCPPLGTIFLDEIGELDQSIAVKLLRVLQTRTFQRLGGTKTRHFSGKVIAATNRDLARQMQAGQFRTDFYYRLCSDMITTPSLREQLADHPDDVQYLVRFIAQHIVGRADGEALTDQVLGWIADHLGADYAWPGNIRELEQCVRNVLIRKCYYPHEHGGPLAGAPGVPGVAASLDRIAEEFRSGVLTADELLSRYCTHVYAQTGSYQQAAQRLGVDRRTLRKKVDMELLEQLKKQ